jgi:hypothetical protein
MMYTYSEHARSAAVERGISEEFVALCIEMQIPLSDIRTEQLIIVGASKL